MKWIAHKVSWLLLIALAASIAWGVSLHRRNRALRSALANLETELQAHQSAPLVRPQTTEQASAMASGAPSIPAPSAPIPAPDINDPGLIRTSVEIDTTTGRASVDTNSVLTRNLASFDRAMDREFNRLELREATAATEQEKSRISAIKNQLLALDELWIEADSQPTPERKLALQQEIRQTMGDIIRRSEQDRRESLADLARAAGLQDEQEISAFVQQIRHIYTTTQMDWSKLFNRAPPGPPPTGPNEISPGMTPADTP